MIAGCRFQIIKDGWIVRLYSASGEDWTKHLSRFAQAFRCLCARSAVLDGVIVIPDVENAPYSHPQRATLRWVRDTELTFFAFDLLHLDSGDLKPMALLERKRRLARLIARSEIRCLHLVQTFDDGDDLLRRCLSAGFQGIVSKRRAASYKSGTCRDWGALTCASATTPKRCEAIEDKNQGVRFWRFLNPQHMHGRRHLTCTWGASAGGNSASRPSLPANDNSTSLPITGTEATSTAQ